MREIHFNRGQLFPKIHPAKSFQASPCFNLSMPSFFSCRRDSQSLCVMLCVFFFSQLSIFIVSQHLFGFDIPDIHLMHFVDVAGFLLLFFSLFPCLACVHAYAGPSSIYFRYSFIFKCFRIHVRCVRTSYIYSFIYAFCLSANHISVNCTGFKPAMHAAKYIRTRIHVCGKLYTGKKLCVHCSAHANIIMPVMMLFEHLKIFKCLLIVFKLLKHKFKIKIKK